MRNIKNILSIAALLLVYSATQAKENVGAHAPAKVDRALSNGCAQDAGAAYLNINNIRARIMDEGDMWWDPGAGLPRYYAPAAGSACAEFAGALWIGGVDAGGQLKIAAMTYRQNGEDFWTGPLDTSTVSITAARCNYYDKLYSLTRAEVQNFVANFGRPGYPIPNDITNWPGNGDQTYGEAKFLAPFVDVVGDGIYDPTQGDYPAYDLKGTNTSCQNEVFGDATLFYVINDEGNTHTETGGIAIGLEIRVQVFAFQTNDAINNMTFYNYQVINRSNYQVNQTYFGAWNDPDLGNGGNDYVGCDVSRNMGYCYNGTFTDPDGAGRFAGEIGYHNDLPAIGEVFFRGPEADPGDSNTCYTHEVDGKRVLKMSKFVYYNNDFSVQGNPQNASNYYNYLKGLWTDGTPMTYGGTGYGGSTPCSYMFCWTPSVSGGPGSGTPTDPNGCGTNGVPQSAIWNEVSAVDPPNDRRFLESAGPFTLKPGAVNNITLGEVFDQPSQLNLGNIYPIGMIQADADLAQALFNSCFKVLDGPDAPDMTITELNQEIIISLSNSVNSNNYKEGYNQVSPTIVNSSDNTYKFEGYQIFQVTDSTVTGTELINNPTKARLVAECDIKNGVGKLTNYTFNPSISTTVPVATVMVSGSDNGIVHSFDIKTDQFQEDNQTNLVNDRPYFYTVVAYAYNNYKTYNPGDTSSDKGQQLPYLQGAHNVKVYMAVPHIPEAQSYGTIQNSTYGEGPGITRIEGNGNGSNVLQLTPQSVAYILANDTMAHPTYQPGRGPINIKVVDPLTLVNANFIVKFYKPTTSKSKTVDTTTRWKIYIPNVGDTVYSDTTIGYQNEQVIPQWGISLTIQDVNAPSANVDGMLDSNCTMTFADPNKPWLTGIPSISAGVSPFFWIRSGNNIDNTYSGVFDSYIARVVGKATYFYDPNSYYNHILGGTWAPYELAAYSDPNLYVDNGPGWNGVDDSLNTMANIDIVFTSDTNKWTRCIVLEEQDETSLSQGNVPKLNIRGSASINKNGSFAVIGSGYSSNPADPNYISDKGMGWFPGYTINLETGERLNMAYGEDSWLAGDNGRDMKWNPDSIITKQNTSATGAARLFGIASVFGGKHYIYVFAHSSGKYSIPMYDKDSTVYAMMNKLPTNLYKNKVLNDVMFVGIPLLARDHSLLETDATVSIRVSKPYDTGYGAPIAGTPWRNNTPDNNNYPMYEFSTNGLGVQTSNITAAKSALDLINVVPNPYYGYSSYEVNRIDNEIRFTNLPPVCTLSIFNLNGTLIKVINKNSPQTYLDWNLQNDYSVPVASGLYIINVNVPNVGERTLKWFGVIRPVDLNSY